MSNKRRLAIARAKKLNIDWAVRVIAKYSHYQEDRNGYLARFENLAIKVSFAEKEAVVYGVDNVLYEASEYGNHIIAFRYGPWVHRLISEAKRLAKIADARSLPGNLAWHRRRDENFNNVDY